MNVPLFAVTEVQLAAIVGAAITVATPLGYAIKWGIDELRKYRAEKMATQERVEEKTEKAKEKKEADLITHLNSLADRYDRESQKIQAKYEAAQRRLAKVERDFGQMKGHIRYLEGILQDKGVKFSPWRDEDSGDDDSADETDGLKTVEVKP